MYTYFYEYENFMELKTFINVESQFIGLSESYRCKFIVC